MFLKKIFKNIFPDFSQKNPVTNSASVPPLPPVFAPFFHFKRFSLQEKYYIKMTNDFKLIFRCFEKKFENLTGRTAFFIMCNGTKRISRPSAGSGRKQGKERKSLYGKVPGPSHVCWLRHCTSLCGHHRKEGAALLGGHPPHAEDLPVHSSGC